MIVCVPTVNRKMRLTENCRRNRRGWRGAVIVAAVCSLTLSLATRFSTSVDSQIHSVKSVCSHSSEPQRQNLDRDASRFAGPVTSATAFQASVLYLHVVPAEPLHSGQILRSDLYNRPPPALVSSV